MFCLYARCPQVINCVEGRVAPAQVAKQSEPGNSGKIQYTGFNNYPYHFEGVYDHVD